MQTIIDGVPVVTDNRVYFSPYKEPGCIQVKEVKARTGEVAVGRLCVPMDLAGFDAMLAAEESFDEADIPEVVDEEEFCPVCTGKNCDGTCEVANCESE